MGYTDDSQLPALSDEDFLASRATVRPCTVRILRGGPNFESPGLDPTTGMTRIIWQHGKRKPALRMAGLMPIICPISDGGDFEGIFVLDATIEEAERILAGDTAVVAGVLGYELYVSRCHAGSSLPAQGAI